MIFTRDTLHGEVTRFGTAASSPEAARDEPRNVEELRVTRAEKEAGEVARTEAVTARDETETEFHQLRREYDHFG